MTNKNLPYTQMIINKAITELETFQIEPIVSLSNPEFIAGAEYAKKEMIKKLKNSKFD